MVVGVYQWTQWSAQLLISQQVRSCPSRICTFIPMSRQLERPSTPRNISYSNPLPTRAQELTELLTGLCLILANCAPIYWPLPSGSH